MSNAKKSEQLGMPYGTAGNKLRKNILFALIQETERDICYRCGVAIENVVDLSIEHKTPWLDSEDPVGLFFNLENIAFSHLNCNSAGSRYRTDPDKISKAMLGHRVKESTKEKIRRAHVGKDYKVYYFVNPDGKQIATDNLSEFSREYGLDRSAISRVASGERQRHKGYWLRTILSGNFE